MTDLFESQLTEMAKDMRSMILSEFSDPDSKECELCGDQEFQQEMLEYECRCEYYKTDCPSHSCDGRVGFFRLYVSVGEMISVEDEKFLAASCSSGHEPEDCLLRDARSENQPVESSDYVIPMQSIATNRICEHHTSYEPEQTMLVCDSCHSKIHHNDGFRPDLQPDMKRKEWESIQN